MEWSRNDPLSWWQRVAYGLGHVQYSLLAAMWFTYLLLFLQYVMQIPVIIAGAIFMIGQLCDGFGTPLVAYHADKLRVKFYGKRKTIHLIGTAVISILFPFIFTRCAGCEDASTWALVLYFIPLVAVFEVAWASVQMSHLSLIPELTSDPKQRDELNIIRYGCEILAAVSVYIFTYTILNAREDTLEEDRTLGPQNAPIFGDLAGIITVLGVAFAALFHLGTPEPKETLEKFEYDSSNSMIWKDWFRLPAFYKVATLFAVSRVITNLFQAFIPLYLQESIKAPHNLIALVPLVIQISGFSGSTAVKPIIRCMKKKSVFMVAATLAFISATWLAWDDPDSIKAGNIYVIATLGGIGGSVMLVLALSFASDLVGDHTTSGGFVFSCFALADRTLNGLTIFAFQIGRGFCTDCTAYYRDIICYGVCLFTIINLLTVLLLSEEDLRVFKSVDDGSSSDGKETMANLLEEKKYKYGAIRKGFQLFGGNKA